MKTAAPTSMNAFQYLPGFPESLDDLHRHLDFVPFGSTSDDWINDEDRMARCHDAAEHGADGSTHAEIMQDWREFLERLTSEARATLDRLELESEEIDALITELDERADAIAAEIDACEAWHEANGSLHEEVG